MNNRRVVVACPIKNDNEYLEEYVEHYLLKGFDKIFFYDNNDDDSIRPELVLREFINDSRVEIIDYRNTPYNDVIHRQHFFTNYDFDWVLFVDDDEFLELPEHDNVKDFLASIDPKITKIGINNIHYGDNERIYYEEGRVQDLFVKPLPLDAGINGYKFNAAIKSFLKRVDYHKVASVNAHILIDDKPYYNPKGETIKVIRNWRTDENDINYEVAFIKHYCTKSLEEFIRCKMKRAGEKSPFKKRFDLNSYYFIYNKKTREKESAINSFLEKYHI